MSLYKPKDTQKDRRYTKLRDQHGRTWGCVIELKSGDPSGPIDLLDPKGAPLMPPPRFMKVNSQKNYGELFIDYDPWIAHQRQVIAAHDKRMMGIATQQYGDAAAEKIASPPPALLHFAGPAPEPVEPILAAKAGDPWVLGFSDVRPKWADKYMPVKPKAKAYSDDLAFMREEEPTDSANGQEANQTESSGGYPVMYAPGRWRLSDGSTVQGKKADALKREGALTSTLATSVSAGSNAGVHQSWSAD